MEGFAMKCVLLTIATCLLLGGGAAAESLDFPKSFRTEEIKANGTTIHVRVGGHGPAVLVVHGYGDTGDMWAPLAVELMSDHTVVAPDLRGMGLSSAATEGFTKKNQAQDLAGVLDALKIKKVDVVGHDIGNMVAFAFAEAYPDRTTRLVMMDAPVPGVGPWEDILKSPLLWHFRFGGPDMERLVAGRERIYLDRFWNEFAASPTGFPEDMRVHYAELYSKPGRMHAGFSQFAAFDQDAVDNRASVAKGRLQMPVLAIGGDHSLGATMAHIMRFAADDVHQVVVRNSGHWLMEEQPAATVAAIRGFLGSSAPSMKPTKLTAEEVAAIGKEEGGAGTSGLTGVKMVVLAGNPSNPGPYAIELHVPAHTRIASHTHRDDRTALVVSGEWHFGYGAKATDASASTLGPGAFYTEPANETHFAYTADKPAVVFISGIGPSDTHYEDAAEAAQVK
jgi:pimeloyl-ACP methyl ester carboxylesterase/quercetin dioxygenase-like cupin family protein